MIKKTAYDPLTSPNEDTDVLTDVLTEETIGYNLIVWNDDVNSFEWVIETLIKICGHSPEQAEQCAILIHFKGKYAVKSGTFEDLKPQCDAINDRQINATIEELVS
jgi:ATP-dependent Clp protease adaptor protein ClpS